MKMKLEKGDPCFVRLSSGEIEECCYLMPGFGLLTDSPPRHFVLDRSKNLISVRRYKPKSIVTGRFVYPVSEMKRQMGLQ